MNTILVILLLIFGVSVLTAIAPVLSITTDFLNIKDRFKKWRDEKKKAKHKKEFCENNPDFKFSLNYLSNPQPGKCNLSVNLLNVSKEVKYIESLEYNYEDPKNRDKFEPSAMFHNSEKWPKRLEHGERVHVFVDFSSFLHNTAFAYWHKGFVVYCTCRTSTGDLLQSNSIDFDKLMGFMEPIEENYKNLAVLLSNKTAGSLRDIEVTLWQLQFFKRLTVHIAKQLQYNNIPIAEYLVSEHGLSTHKNIWVHWYRELEQKKIQPRIIEEFLKSLL
nr:hypothetical protein [uncultured Flavobacterium sp.]